MENTAYRSDINEFLTGKYSHSYYSSSGIVMGKAVFYPMVSKRCYKFDKKYKRSKQLPKDYQENADSFIENIKAAFGEDFLKDKKIMAVPPEKQYKKALKINKK